MKGSHPVLQVIGHGFSGVLSLERRGLGQAVVENTAQRIQIHDLQEELGLPRSALGQQTRPELQTMGYLM